MGRGAEHLARSGESFFAALLANELRGARHVGTIGDVEWIAAWAPAHQKEISNYDTWFAPKFVGDEVHTEAPEAYAARLRARFRARFPAGGRPRAASRGIAPGPRRARGAPAW